MTDDQKAPQQSHLFKENKKNILLYRKTLAEAEEAREKRDEQNELVAGAKRKREELAAQMKQLKNELSEKENALRQIGPVGNPRALERELERAEWLLQTEATSPGRERELAKKAKDISEELVRAKKAAALRQEASVLKKKLAGLATEAKAVHQTLLMHARESDVFHKKSIGLRRKAEELRKSISANLEKIGAEQRAQEAGLAQALSAKKAAEAAAQQKAKAELLAREAEKILEEFRKGKRISSDEISVIQASL